MTIDIIIPCYNCEATLDRALASVATQKLDPDDSLSVTLVNDCSTSVANYFDFVTKWIDTFYIQEIDKEVNEGAGQARQTGLDNTDGDYIMFLDADDVLGSPFAVRTLSREMKKTGNDVVMGEFIEETVDGKIFHHEMNWIWHHGKMYNRRTIERFNLRFNHTRYCEDTGYHSVLSNLTDRYSYIPQVVYIWQNQKDSTVRQDQIGYAYGYGWRDLLENLAWAAEELISKKINKAIIRDYSAMALSRVFMQLNNSLNFLPEEQNENIRAVIDFYMRACRPFVLEGGMRYEHISRNVIEALNEHNFTCVPSITLKQFLTLVGFYEDRQNCED